MHELLASKHQPIMRSAYGIEHRRIVHSHERSSVPRPTHSVFISVAAAAYFLLRNFGRSFYAWDSLTPALMVEIWASSGPSNLADTGTMLYRT